MILRLMLFGVLTAAYALGSSDTVSKWTRLDMHVDGGHTITVTRTGGEIASLEFIAHRTRYVVPTADLPSLSDLDVGRLELRFGTYYVGDHAGKDYVVLAGFRRTGTAPSEDDHQLLWVFFKGGAYESAFPKKSKKPNKSPEPTPTAVTPRATERKSK